MVVTKEYLKCRAEYNVTHTNFLFTIVRNQRHNSSMVQKYTRTSRTEYKHFFIQ